MFDIYLLCACTCILTDSRRFALLCESCAQSINSNILTNSNDGSSYQFPCMLLYYFGQIILINLCPFHFAQSRHELAVVNDGYRRIIEILEETQGVLCAESFHSIVNMGE